MRSSGTLATWQAAKKIHAKGRRNHSQRKIDDHDQAEMDGIDPERDRHRHEGSAPAR